jgi:phosphatidylserine/phosphatidylglycerophosphate/cardiolipin synthase-like enzyme
MTPVAMATRVARNLVKAFDKQPDNLPEFMKSRKKLTASDSKLPGGRHSAQLMRTQPMYKEKSIKECYANLTRLAKRYIFIQNHPVRGLGDVPDRLRQKVSGCRLRQASVRVHPILTSTPESDGMDIATYDVARQIALSNTMAVEHAEAVEQAKRGKAQLPISADELAKQGINVLMASMWSCAPQPRSADDYEEIYIHAKVAIVDDAAFTIGSANLNVRSMALDSELNVLSEALDVAMELRRRLFKQCTGDEGPAQFDDMGKTFNKWQELMNDNLASKKKGRRMSGQILPFHVDRKPGSPVI